MIRGLLDRIKGNPLEKVGIQELRDKELRLKVQLEQVRKDIDYKEKEIKRKLQEGVGVDLHKKQMLAQEIEALGMEAKLKLKSFDTLYRQLTFIQNLLIVKNYEKQLKEKGIWKELISILRYRLWEDPIFTRGPLFTNFTDIKEVLEDLEEKKLLEKIRDMWQKVESGILEPEKAETGLFVSRELQKMEAKLKLWSFYTFHRQLTFIRNFLILKDHEKKLKKKELKEWKKLKKALMDKRTIFIYPPRIISVLEELRRLSEMEVAEVEREVAEVERKVKEEEKKLLDMLQKAESGTLEPEKAETELSISRELQKEE